MYCLYIPKYQGTEREDLLLPEELTHFMEKTKYAYDLLVSPGYLSKTDATIQAFVTEMEGMLAPAADGAVGVGLFHGMNGHNAVTKGSTEILAVHSREIALKGKLTEIKVDSAKKNDHRKMIFFFERDGCTSLGSLDGGNKKDFLEKVKVKAVLIGSSNFSLSTYFNGGTGPAQKGEADLLLFLDDEYKEDVKGRIDGDNGSAGEKMVLFTSLAGGEDPGGYFKYILTDFLDHFLK